MSFLDTARAAVRLSGNALATAQSTLPGRLRSFARDSELSWEERTAVTDVIQSTKQGRLYELSWLPGFRDEFLREYPVEEPDSAHRTTSFALEIVEDSDNCQLPIGWDSDPLAEVDFALADGRYTDAEETIRAAIAAAPDRAAFLAKLCEVLFCAKREDAFLLEAERLHSLTTSPKSDEWAIVAKLGRALVPDHPLFDDVPSTSASTGVEVDAVESALPADALDFHDQDDALFYCIAEEPPARDTWTIRFTDNFLKSISKLDAKMQGRIMKVLTKLVRDPVKANGNTTKPLSGELDGLWRWRIGDFRLVYDPQLKEKAVVLISVGPRSSIYQ